MKQFLSDTLIYRVTLLLLRLRIRTLEEVNRELKEQLEVAYGRLAMVQPKLGHYTKRQE